jgi:hypothetical protein
MQEEAWQVVQAARLLRCLFLHLLYFVPPALSSAGSGGWRILWWRRRVWPASAGFADNRYEQSTGEHTDDKATSPRVKKTLSADGQNKYPDVEEPPTVPRTSPGLPRNLKGDSP